MPSNKDTTPAPPRPPLGTRVRSDTFRHSRASVRRARVFASRVLADWSAPVNADDVRVCVSEMCTNALLHGGRPGRLFLVRLSLSETALTVEVHDGSSAAPRPRSAAEGDESGRGLLVVAALSDRWGMRSRDGIGKLVYAEFDVPAR
ncbi:ATP-binding protein [Streptomyces sp. MAR4 CNX-425]|uniref:ATP-binding protein n=1 Tax=Streptomyces sp. MAR4 CNX-425 TaxID=3406343 RepID=UPI003B50BF4B